MVCFKCGKKIWIWSEKKYDGKVYCKKCYESINKKDIETNKKTKEEIKCERCGKHLKAGEGSYHIGDNSLLVCYECSQIMYKEAEEKREIEERKTEEITFKEVVSKSDLLVSELQLQELKRIKNDMMQVKNDIRTISNIVIIWFILGLIGLGISILTWISWSSMF